MERVVLLTDMCRFLMEIFGLNEGKDKTVVEEVRIIVNY